MFADTSNTFMALFLRQGPDFDRQPSTAWVSTARHCKSGCDADVGNELMIQQIFDASAGKGTSGDYHQQTDDPQRLEPVEFSLSLIGCTRW